MTGADLISLVQLRKALATLTHQQGRIGRRNARTRVASALRRVADDVAAQFPAFEAPRKPPRRRRTVMEIRRDLIKQGWVVVPDASLLMRVIVELRLPTRITLQPSNLVQVAPVMVPTPAPPPQTWCPGWVAHYYPNKTAIQAARKNSKLIVAAKAAVRLGSLQDHIKKGIIQCPPK